jgi:tRNA nucleotidyltransferase (CCA-adding enzyme)
MDCAVYLVGGFVRDLLLEVPSTDLDIVIEGESLSFAENLNQKLCSSKLTLHSSFGTAHLELNDGTHLDIAGSRREDYDFPGALPTVEKSTLKEDLFRRDFTINAMALCLNESCFGEIIDYYGGFRDLQQKEIRFLHNLSFIEDPTRILRAIRFAGRYGFKLAKITRDAIVTALEAQVFANVSPERFTEEILLIYNEPNYQAMGEKLIEYGVFGSWFKFDLPWNYSIQEGEEKQWPLEKRWLVSIKDIDNLGINKILEQLTLNKPLHKITLEYLRLREDLKPGILSPSKIDELLSGVPEVLIQVLLYQDEFAQVLKQYIIALSEVNMKITGGKLIQLGFKEGPIIGKILRQIRNLWLEGRIRTPAEEEKFIEGLLNSKNEG